MQKHLNLLTISLATCFAIGAWGVLSPTTLAASGTWFTGLVYQSLDWFFMGVVTVFLVICFWLAFGRYGGLVLGKEGDTPEFSYGSWLAMLFSAGIGSGLVFWGVAEPMMHYAVPPIGPSETPASARHAMVITCFHWGFHAWGVYAIGGLVLAYFGFRREAPYLAGSPIRDQYRGPIAARVADLADLLAVIAVVFGVAGALVMGTMQLRTGLHAVFGTDNDSMAIQLGLLAVLGVTYMASASTSLEKGIRILSNINIGLATGLLIFVLLAGPTSFLMRNFLTTLGDYIAAIPSLTLETFPYQEAAGNWLHGWTLNYFVWWISWVPFVGIFIARISRGRTIREFVAGVVIAPSIISVLWFSVFGGVGLAEEAANGGLALLVQEDVPAALFSLYETLPLTAVANGVSIVLLFIFLVTSADSATFVLGMLTSKGSVDPPVKVKLAWGVALGLLAVALALTRSWETTRVMAVVGAIPFTFVVLLQVGALFRALPNEELE